MEIESVQVILKPAGKKPDGVQSEGEPDGDECEDDTEDTKDAPHGEHPMGDESDEEGK